MSAAVSAVVSARDTHGRERAGDNHRLSGEELACIRGVIRGETAPVAWTSRGDSPVVTSRIVRLVHEVVETTELLARGLASLRDRGRHWDAALGSVKLLPLCAGPN